MALSRGAQPIGWWAAFTYGIPALYALILILFANRVGAGDYDQFLVFHELQYWNASLFGLAKQWSPVMCSGMSLAGEPQVPFASLTMLLSYAWGPLAGIVAGTLVYLVVGWCGAYLYSGIWLDEPRPRALAASLYIGNGFFICRIAHGHVDFIPFLALPLALWMIHRVSDRKPPWLTFPNQLLGVLLLGGLLAAAIDGSPVAIIYLIFWIGLYCAVLSWTRRSVLPLITFAAACSLASFLDAGYLWPMLEAQADFPRRTADTFTGPWSLAWFMLIPMRGKVLPSNGTGIELSVFIGPFLAFLIWRYRNILREQLPREMKLPLCVVSVISIWLGMGSLHVAHLPVWLSPFDWVRPLPGFRSMGVTGRYWGFLALPLSLLAAAALWRYIQVESRLRHRTLLLSGALLTQLTFQGESLASAWFQSRVYEPVSVQGLYTGRPQPIQRVLISNTQQQGELISPVREAVNCYDMDDFTRAPVGTGSQLVQTVRTDSRSTPAPALRAGFVTWNRIRIEAPEQDSPAAALRISAATSHSWVRITLNQAYHSGWTSANCLLKRGDRDNLVADCPRDVLRDSGVDLVFSDPVSALGMRVSLRAATALTGLAAVLGLLSLQFQPKIGTPVPRQR